MSDDAPPEDSFAKYCGNPALRTGKPGEGTVLLRRDPELDELGFLHCWHMNVVLGSKGLRPFQGTVWPTVVPCCCCHWDAGDGGGVWARIFAMSILTQQGVLSRPAWAPWL